MDTPKLNMLLEPSSKPHRPATNNATIFPLEQLRERLDLIEQIEEKQRSFDKAWNPDTYFFSVFLLTPMEMLQELAQNTGHRRAYLGSPLDSIRKLVPKFLAKGHNKKINQGTTAQTDSACHIIPLAMSKTEEGRMEFKGLLLDALALLSVDDQIEEEKLKYLYRYYEISDKIWNMVCLSPQLHVWWGKAYFAFKCTGIILGEMGGDSLVSLEFHWMPKKINDWRRNELSLDEYKEKVSSLLANNRSPMLGSGADPRVSYLPLETGDLFEVSCPTVDVEKMKMAFDIRWSLCCIAALAGAADGDEDTAEYNDSTDPLNEVFPDVKMMDVENWIGEVISSTIPF